MNGEKKDDQITNFSKDVKNHHWWVEDVSSVLRPEVRQMLEKYSGIPSDKVVEHIKEARAQAYKYGPYASVGALTWLNSYLLLHDAHKTVLDKVKAGATILDCGCFFAPDLRQLAYEGAPTDRMYGFDIEPAFFDIGFDFYNDRKSFKAEFFAANVTEDLDASPLGRLKGKVDIIWAAKIVHLFDREHQIEVAARLVALLKPQPGSMFVGSQNGLPNERELPLPSQSFQNASLGSTFFMHNAETIKKDWDEVAKRTGTKWNVESRLLDLRTIGRHEDDGSEYKRRTGYNLQWTATLIEPAKAKI